MPAATSPAAVRLEVLDGAIALLTLDQPGSRANTLSQAVVAELETAAAEIQGRSGLRGLILQSGKPGMFIAGADLKELGGRHSGPDVARDLVRRGLEVIAAFE